MRPLLTLAFLLMAGSAWGDEATSPLASDPTRVCVVSVGGSSGGTCVKSVTKEEYAALPSNEHGCVMSLANGRTVYSKECGPSAPYDTPMEHDSVTCDSLHPVGSGGCLPGSSAPARRPYSVDDVNRLREIERHKYPRPSIPVFCLNGVCHPTVPINPAEDVAIESRVQTDILAGIGPDELEKAK